MARDQHRQHTLAAAIHAAGAGLHSGFAAAVAVKPAPAGTGVVFRRIDFDRPLDDTLILARADFVVETRLGVTLRNKAGAEVRTIEHLLAALHLLGVDNALVEIDGPEAPILDGSGAPWAALIRAAGLAPQNAPRLHLVVDRPYRVESGARFVEITPFAGRLAHVTIEFQDAAIGRQEAALRLDDEAAAERILSARTFCSLKDVEAMRAAGLGQGGSLENSIVVDDARIVNEGGLRDADEFALHKMLDLIGDLSLIGAPLVGRIRAHKSGHDLHTALARLLVKESLAAPKPDLSALVM